MEVIIIAAIAKKNLVIGKDGGIPWHSSDEIRKAELKHFKETTLNSAIIMGRTTYETIGRPLPNRLNVVLSRSDIEIEGVTVCHSFEEAIKLCEGQGYERAFICGGASVYNAGLAYANKMVLTEIPGDYDGDTFFPKWNDDEWKEINREKHDLFEIVTYIKV